MRLNQSAFVQPHCLSPGVATGHIPFGAWLIEALNPRVLVELGTFHGESYLAFCQTVNDCNMRTKCFAAGPWQVADRPIEFQDDIFQTLSRQNEAHASFSRLIRAGYATAARQFEDGSIDILHLPRDADFESLEEITALWQPKLSADGVVLVQAIDATQPSRAKFWEAFSRGKPNFEFKHNKGLGVVFANEATKRALGLDGDPEQALLAELLFDRLTFAIENQSAHEWTKLELDLQVFQARQEEQKLLDAEKAVAVLQNDMRGLNTAHAIAVARLQEDAATALAASQAEAEALRGELARHADENATLAASVAEARGKLGELRVSLESALRNLGESEEKRVAQEAELARFWLRVGTSIDRIGQRLRAIPRLRPALLTHEGVKRPLLSRYLIRNGQDG